MRKKAREELIVPLPRTFSMSGDRRPIRLFALLLLTTLFAQTVTSTAMLSADNDSLAVRYTCRADALKVWQKKADACVAIIS